MPAGTFAESAYYLPWAFGYLRENREEAFEYLGSLVHWISEHANELRNVHETIRQVRKAMDDCLTDWTREFEVVHLDEEACRAGGCGILYHDYVMQSGIVCELIDSLCREKADADVAVQFVDRLASKDATPTQSAWFLELVNQFNCGHFRDWKRWRHRKVLTALKDDSLWRHHAAIVLEKAAPNTRSPTYWDETLFFLS